MGLRQLLADESRPFISVKPSDRTWETPVATAPASGLPIFVGAAHGDLGLGLAGSLGGLGHLVLALVLAFSWCLTPLSD